jgi:hypothetical protein
MRLDLTRSHFIDSSTFSKQSSVVNNNDSDESSNYRNSSNIKIKNSIQSTTSSNASISSEEAIRLSGLVAKTRALFESNNSKICFLIIFFFNLKYIFLF